MDERERGENLCTKESRTSRSRETGNDAAAVDDGGNADRPNRHTNYSMACVFRLETESCRRKCGHFFMPIEVNLIVAHDDVL